MNANTKLGRDLKNRLTDYSLACGYLDVIERQGINIRLYKEAGCKVYQVIKHDHNNGKRIFWETFKTRCKAYVFFNKEIKKLSII